MDYRNELLTMREQTMENIDSMFDELIETGALTKEMGDDIVTRLCDMICETIDPAGF